MMLSWVTETTACFNDKAEIAFAVELSVDSDGDRTMSCADCNNAYAVKEAIAFVTAYLRHHNGRWRITRH
jgi:hypothetical protein